MRKLIPIVLAAVLVLSCSKNTPPVIEYFVAEPDSVFPGDTVTITFKVSDADGDGIQYMLGKSSGTWGTDFGSIEPTTWIAPNEPGDYYLTLMIGDLSDQVTDSVLIHVFDTVGFFTDARDGHQYKWVKIGSQIWMAENLAYLPSVGYSYKGSTTEQRCYVFGYKGEDVTEAKASLYYQTYGALYNWTAALNVCPDGWHLPTDEEWKILEKHLGMSQSDLDEELSRISGDVGHKLKETGTAHWDSPNSLATNSVGFNARPGGIMAYAIGFTGFSERGRSAYYWSSTDVTNRKHFSRMRWLSYQSPAMERPLAYSSYGLSVRCVKDE